MPTTGSEWQSRTQRRRNLELAMLKRPSESEDQSTSSEPRSATSPTSPESAYSTADSSVHSADHLHYLQALQAQLKTNAAQIEANEARMREIADMDEQLGRSIQERLSAVVGVNQKLSLLRGMLETTHRACRGDAIGES